MDGVQPLPIGSNQIGWLLWPPLAQEMPATFVDQNVDQRANVSLGHNERISTI